jgi:hypothetical protein
MQFEGRGKLVQLYVGSSILLMIEGYSAPRCAIAVPFTRRDGYPESQEHFSGI